MEEEKCKNYLQKMNGVMQSPSLRAVLPDRQKAGIKLLKLMEKADSQETLFDAVLNELSAYEGILIFHGGNKKDVYERIVGGRTADSISGNEFTCRD